MKKLINDPAHVVEEMVEGLVAVYPGLRRVKGFSVLVRADIVPGRNDKVALISGGGSGHEPAHAGYVGEGMLAAAVAGDVFTSPSPDAVLAAIRAVTGPAGALLIIKNYTGDRLNFGLAAELARSEGLKVEMVVVADDVALASLPGASQVGRRGLAGTVFVHKIAGAAAAEGKSLSKLAAAANAAIKEVGTMGVALSPCTVPAAGKPSFTLGETEIELGLGIHGEPGVKKGPLERADAIVEHLLEAIAKNTPLQSGDRVALMINNLGATPTMELAIVARQAILGLEKRGVVVERVYMGTFLSALEMGGVSLSALKVDDARIAALDAPTDAPAWPNPASVTRTRPAHVSPIDIEANIPTADYLINYLPKTSHGQALEVALMAATSALIAATDRLTEMDRKVGDGDLGISLSRGSQAIRANLPKTPLDDPAAALLEIGRKLQESLGGTSGPLYAVMFLRAAAVLKTDPGRAIADPALWGEAFRAGCNGMVELGGAHQGDRTMLDALLPAIEAFQAALGEGQPWKKALENAAAAAEAGAAATSAMSPRRGRSSYLGDRAVGYPDPGAEAVALWIRALSRALTGK